MDNVATASIKAFGQSPKADFVSTSEQLITLTYGQLQDLVTKTIEKAIQPLQDHISSLEDRIFESLEEENASMSLKLVALETTEERDISHLALDIAYDRQRLAKLEKVEPQPLQKDRGEILRALIVANGGKMLPKDASQKMHLIKPRFSELLATMKDDIEIRPYHLRKNQKVLVLK